MRKFTRSGGCEFNLYPKHHLCPKTPPTLTSGFTSDAASGVRFGEILEKILKDVGKTGTLLGARLLGARLLGARPWAYRV